MSENINLILQTPLEKKLEEVKRKRDEDWEEFIAKRSSRRLRWLVEKILALWGVKVDRNNIDEKIISLAKRKEENAQLEKAVIDNKNKSYLNFLLDRILLDLGLQPSYANIEILLQSLNNQEVIKLLKNQKMKRLLLLDFSSLLPFVVSSGSVLFLAPGFLVPFLTFWVSCSLIFLIVLPAFLYGNLLDRLTEFKLTEFNWWFRFLLNPSYIIVRISYNIYSFYMRKKYGPCKSLEEFLEEERKTCGLAPSP